MATESEVKAKAVKVREELAALVAQHEAVKALRQRSPPRSPTTRRRSGVPRLFRDSLDDANVHSAVTSWRRVMRYHQRVLDMTRSRIAQEEQIDPEVESALRRQRANIERSFRDGIDATFGVVRAYKEVVQAYSSAVLETVPAQRYPALTDPLALSRDEQIAMQYLRVLPTDYTKQQERFRRNRTTATRHWEDMLKLAASRRLDSAARTVETAIKKINFPEFPSDWKAEDTKSSGGTQASRLLSAGAIAAYGVATGVGGVLRGALGARADFTVGIPGDTALIIGAVMLLGGSAAEFAKGGC